MLVELGRRYIFGPSALGNCEERLADSQVLAGGFARLEHGIADLGVLVGMLDGAARRGQRAGKKREPANILEVMPMRLQERAAELARLAGGPACRLPVALGRHAASRQPCGKFPDGFLGRPQFALDFVFSDGEANA